MEILNFKDVELKNCTMTIGNFDGVHLGHVEIINCLKRRAILKKTKSLLITFDPHPAQALGKLDSNYLITSLDKKIKLLSDLGLDYLCIIDFSDDFADMRAESFIENVLYKKFNPTDIVVGYDHCFGKDRRGSFSMLYSYKDKFSYNLHKIDKIEVDGFSVKSSEIRDFISKGKVKSVRNLLGRDFSFSGTVVKGEGLGRKLSFPTANISIESSFQLLPKRGVYHIDLFIKKDNKKYDSVCNIGTRPTFNKKKDVQTIEVHILSGTDFSIYGCEVELFFKSRIRDEKKFNDEKELINQINLDKEYCINN